MPIQVWDNLDIAGTPGSGNEADTVVAVLTGGGYVVAWSDSTDGDYDIYMRRYDQFGVAVGAAVRVNTNNALSDFNARITALPNGGWAVGWIENDANVYVQRYNADGTSNGGAIPIALNGAGNFIHPLELAALSNGTIAAVYTANTGGATLAEVQLRVIATNGSVGSIIAVNTTTANEQSSAYVTTSGNNILVTWTDNSAGNYDLRSRLFDAAGTALTAETTVSNAAGPQYFSPIARLSDGRFVIVYYNNGALSAQFMTGSGAVSGPAISLTGTNGFISDVVAIANGGFIVVSDSGYVTAYNSTGEQQGAQFLLSPNVNSPALAAFSDGRIVAAFITDSEAVSQILDPRDGVVDGNSGTNTLIGNNFINDTIRGFSGADTLFGLGGADFLLGGFGADTLYGGNGNDSLSGEAGNDRIYGGDGDDIALYNGAYTGAGVSIVRLANGSIRVTGAAEDGTDILRGVEHVRFADRTIDVQGYARNDVNGDGDSDIIYFSQAGGTIGSFSMQDGFRTGTGAGTMVGDPASGVWDVQATGDFNYDGNSDLVLKNQSTGQFYVWTVQNGVQVGGANLGTIGTNWDIRSTGDFNADGNADVLWRDSTNGQFYIWTLNASIQQTSGTSLGTLGANWDAGPSGDFDGDGDSDVLLRDSTNGHFYIYQIQNGAQVGGASLGVLGSAWTIANVGDFNGDGLSDIALKNTSTGQFYLYLMNSNLSFTGSDLGIIGTDWNIASTGDYNEDGTDDILWRNANTGQIYVWQMEDGRQATTGSNHLGFVSADTVIV
jgi:Ca2+-binding RTX toxin-like protein